LFDPGTTSQEIDINSPAEHWTWSETNYTDFVLEKLMLFGPTVAHTALGLYPANVSTPEFQLSSLISDLRVVCGNDYMALVMSAAFTSPVYRYVATYYPQFPSGVYGDLEYKYSFHGIDTFAYFDATSLIVDHLTGEDKQWQTNVQQEVLDFVRGGHGFDKRGRYPEKTLKLTDRTEVTSGYHTQQCMFWLANGFFSYSWIN